MAEQSAAQGVEFEDTLALRLNIYPNPTPGVFRVDLGGLLLDHFALELRNMSGSLLYADAFQQERRSYFKLDISSLSAGIYFLRLTATESGETFVGKVVKSH